MGIPGGPAKLDECWISRTWTNAAFMPVSSGTSQATKRKEGGGGRRRRRKDKEEEIEEANKEERRKELGL